jgi:UDP-GlcNAc:undecaprenyl-phosphate GlcNAc-1-phosphate transferase
MAYANSFAIALALAAGLTAVVRSLALRRGLVDPPRADRWHRRPVPRLGGVAIYAAFTVTLLAAWQSVRTSGVLGLLAGGTAIFLVGLLDDRRRLESRTKLVLLIVCAVIPSLAGIRFTFFAPLLAVPLTILWTLGITNAFNWLDNMDGVAAGVAIIVATNLALFDAVVNGGDIMPVALILAGAASGFLLHNFPPARIFMGDSGSGFLGYMVATLAVIGSYRNVSNVMLAVTVPAMIMAVPIFDTAMVTLTRLLNRQPLLKGGRDHPAHRLVAMGLPERRVVLLIYGLSAAAGASGLAAGLLSPLASTAVSIVLMASFIALGSALADLRVDPKATPGATNTWGTPAPRGRAVVGP